MPSIRQRFHLSPCSDFRSHFFRHRMHDLLRVGGTGRDGPIRWLGGLTTGWRNPPLPLLPGDGYPPRNRSYGDGQGPPAPLPHREGYPLDGPGQRDLDRRLRYPPHHGELHGSQRLVLQAPGHQLGSLLEGCFSRPTKKCRVLNSPRLMVGGLSVSLVLSPPAHSRLAKVHSACQNSPRQMATPPPPATPATKVRPKPTLSNQCLIV